MSYQEQPDDGLTDEERAALAMTDEPTGEAEDVNEDEQPNATEEDEQANAGAAVADPDAAAAAVADAPAADAVAEQPAAGEPEAKQSAAAPETKTVTSAPVLIVTAPEDAAVKLADLEKKMEALATQLDDGEITGAQFQVELSKVNREHLDLKLKVERAELAQQMEAQRLQNQWQNDCNAFLTAHPEYQDQDRLKLLDETIRALASMPSNQGLANDKALAKAHRMVMVELGEATPAAPAPAAKAFVQPNVPKPAAPPNIGTLPSASMNDTTGGEFAGIEAIRKSGDVERYEDALSGLSEAARARYLRS